MEQPSHHPAPTYPCRACQAPVFVDKILCSCCDSRRAALKLEVTVSLLPWLSKLGSLVSSKLKADPCSQLQIRIDTFPWAFFKALHRHVQSLPGGQAVPQPCQTKGQRGGRQQLWSFAINSPQTIEMLLAPKFPEDDNHSMTLRFFPAVRIAAYPTMPFVFEWMCANGQEYAAVLRVTYDVCVLYESGKFGWPDQDFSDAAKIAIRRRMARLLLAVGGSPLPSKMEKEARSILRLR